jgi:hypothetical protein
MQKSHSFCFTRALGKSFRLSLVDIGFDQGVLRHRLADFVSTRRTKLGNFLGLTEHFPNPILKNILAVSLPAFEAWKAKGMSTVLQDYRLLDGFFEANSAFAIQGYHQRLFHLRNNRYSLLKWYTGFLVFSIPMLALTVGGAIKCALATRTFVRRIALAAPIAFNISAKCFAFKFLHIAFDTSTATFGVVTVLDNFASRGRCLSPLVGGWHCSTFHQIDQETRRDALQTNKSH